MTAAELESALAALRQDSTGLDGATVQRLLAAAVELYAAKVAADGPLPAFVEGAEPSATAVCLAVAEMLDAVSVEVFELALWKAWASGSR